MDQARSEERTRQEGRITALRVQQKNPERVSVYLDGRFAFGLYQDVVLSHGLRKGQVLSVAEQEALLAADAVLVAKAKALSYLAYRARSRFEVRRKLLRGGFDEAVVAQVLDRLEELGYLDDAAYARAYAQGRFETGGYGPQRVRSDLMRRGVARAVIDRVLADVFSEQDDILETARAQAERRWARLAGEEDPRKRRKKLYDFLLRRGFSYDTIRRVADELEAA